MGLAIARAPAASDASRKPSAPLSSRWLAPIRQGGRSVRGAGGELESRDEEKEAHWTLDALTTAAQESVGSPLGEARYVAFCSSKG